MNDVKILAIGQMLGKFSDELRNSGNSSLGYIAEDLEAAACKIRIISQLPPDHSLQKGLMGEYKILDSNGRDVTDTVFK